MPQNRRLSLRSKLLLALVVVIAVLIPIQFWRGVWFGGELDEEEVGRALAATESARRVQHALSWVEGRIREGDASARTWYSQIARLAEHPLVDIRLQVAWVMGQDNESQLFHQTLLELLRDPEPIVRRNAALGLTRFADRKALPELRAMLQPFSLQVSASGPVLFLVRAGELVARGGEVAQVGDEQPVIVSSPLPGRVLSLERKPGETIQKGQTLLTLAPEPEHVWEALRALLLVGVPEDLPLVRSILDDRRFSRQIHDQARSTLEVLQERVER